MHNKRTQIAKKNNVKTKTTTKTTKTTTYLCGPLLSASNTTIEQSKTTKPKFDECGLTEFNPFASLNTGRACCCLLLKQVTTSENNNQTNKQTNKQQQQQQHTHQSPQSRQQLGLRQGPPV
jgi:flagellar motor protein MotB